jgi:probable phosphoglycerate mutase
MLTVLLTRHGLTDRSVPEQYLGQRIEAHLTDEGREAARALGERIAQVPLARVLSSPLERAAETARLIRPDADVEMDPRLAEIDYGDWEGVTVAEIQRRWPDARAMWEADPAGFAVPDGENGQDVARRVRSVLEELIEWDAGLDPRDEDRRVLIVGHSTVDRVLLATCLGVPLRDYRRRFRMDWASLTVLRFGGAYGSGAQLLVCNDVSHLRGTAGATWDATPD